MPGSSFFPGTLSVFCCFFLIISASSSASSASTLAPFEGSFPWSFACYRQLQVGSGSYVNEPQTLARV